MGGLTGERDMRLFGSGDFESSRRGTWSKVRRSADLVLEGMGGMFSLLELLSESVSSFVGM